MKTTNVKFKKCMLVVFCLIAYFDTLQAQIILPKREWHYNGFKNASADSANDFHIVAKYGGKFKAIGIRSPLDGGGVPAFPGKILDPPEGPAGWSSSENHIPIPPDGTLDVGVEGNSVDRAKSYFTKDGDSLKTVAVPIYYEVVPGDPIVSSGNYIIRNEDTLPVVITGISAHVDNNVDPFITGSYTPTGTPVPGIPPNMVLNPGDSAVFPYISSNIHKFVSFRAVAFSIAYPADVFEDGVVLSFDVLPEPLDSITSASSGNPSSSGNPACSGDTVTLTAHGGTLGTGGVIRWYLNGCGSGAAIDTGVQINVALAVAGVFTYYARIETANDTTDCDSLVITVNNCCLIPDPPTISGTTSLCTPTGNIPCEIIAESDRGTFFLWSPPPGTTIASGQGNDSIVLNFTTASLGNGINGNICVVASNICGSSTATCKKVDYNSVKPVTPPSISGPAKVCPGDNVIYSIANVARASAYNWSVPSGMIITNGTGSNIITVNVLTGYAGGTISVSASNVCGTSPLRSKSVNLNIAGRPVPISGSFDGNCDNTKVYSISPVSNATGYEWTVSGGTISGSNSGLSVVVDWNAALTTGQISVIAINGCGNSLARSATVTGAPGTPGVIAGLTSVCTGSVQHYAVATVAGTDYYAWSAPGTVVAGQGSKEIDVQYGSTPFANQIISVTASNVCGTSPVRILNGLTANVCPRLAGETYSDGLIVYPNPAKSNVNVEFYLSEEQDYQLQFHDVTGRIIQNHFGEAHDGLNKIEVNTELIKDGIYFIYLLTKNEVRKTKLFVR